MVRHHTDAAQPVRDNRITPERGATDCSGLKRENIMNKYLWGGVIIWGIFITFFGLGAMSPVRAAAPDQEVIFLLAAGLVTCFVGLVGLATVMTHIPGFARLSSRTASFRSA